MAYRVTDEWLSAIYEDRAAIIRLARMVETGECSPAWAIGAAVAAGLVEVEGWRAAA